MEVLAFPRGLGLRVRPTFREFRDTYLWVSEDVYFDLLNDRGSRGGFVHLCIL